jgi:hypothetical protein
LWPREFSALKKKERRMGEVSDVVGVESSDRARSYLSEIRSIILGDIHE